MKKYKYDDSKLSPGKWAYAVVYNAKPKHIVGVNMPVDGDNLDEFPVIFRMKNEASGKDIDEVDTANAAAICQIKPSLKALWLFISGWDLNDFHAGALHQPGNTVYLSEEYTPKVHLEFLQILMDAGVVTEVKEYHAR